MDDAEKILRDLKPIALQIKDLEEILKISPEKRINTDVVLSMGP